MSNQPTRSDLSVRAGSLTIETIQKLIKASEEARTLHPAEAPVFAQEALQAAQMLNNKPLLAHAYRNHAYSLMTSGEYNEASQMIKEAFKIYTNSSEDLPGQAQAHYIQCAISIRLSDYYTSLLHALKAFSIAESLQMTDLLTRCHNTLSFVYESSGDLDSALEFSMKGLTLCEQTNNISFKGNFLINLARIYLLSKEYDFAIKHADEGIKLKKEVNDVVGLVAAYNVKTRLLIAMDRLDEAEEALALSKEHDERARDLFVSTLICISEGNIKCKRENYVEAKHDFDISIDMAKKLNSRELEYEALYGKYICSRELGQFQLALSCLEGYHKLKDEVKGQQTSRKISSLQSQNNIRLVEKEAEIFKIKNIELEQIRKELEGKNQKIISSLNYARRIQETLLPTRNVSNLLFKESFVIYKPKDIVGGDFYWIDQRGNHLFMAAVDCTGHGVPASFLSIIGYYYLNQAVRSKRLTDPAAILAFLDRLVTRTFSQTSEDSIMDGMDLSLCVINLTTRELSYAGAFNSIIIAEADKFTELKADRQRIGPYSFKTHFHAKHYQLPENAFIYQYSDGFHDQLGGPRRRKLGSRHFKEILQDIKHLPAAEQKDRLNKILKSWQGSEPQTDDILVWGVKV